MRILFSLLAVLLAQPASGQGIEFAEGSWQSIVSKAQAANKLIYVDVYTTWCGPCKLMEKNVFPQEAVRKKYNQHFISCRVDAEKGEGIALARRYHVGSYPTHLYIDPQTEALVYTQAGYLEAAG